ncbi:MAG: helix-turn-helix transcriptional regulator, partial [Stellaceae bacterium]
MGRRERLGSIVKVHREHKNLSQDEVARKCGVNRTPVAYLEQGFRFPKPELLEKICSLLDIPKPQWEPLTRPESLHRFDFEDLLAELVGHAVDLDSHDSATQNTAEELITSVFLINPTEDQLRSTFNSVLVYYGVGPVSDGFFRRYFTTSSFGSLKAFDEAIKKYQMDAIRLFSTFGEAFEIR